MVAERDFGRGGAERAGLRSGITLCCICECCTGIDKLLRQEVGEFCLCFLTAFPARRMHPTAAGSRCLRSFPVRRIQQSAAASEETLQKYTKTDSPEYKRMVSEIARRLNLSSLKFTKLEDLVKAIGLPKCHICTHCFDGSSAFTLEETNE